MKLKLSTNSGKATTTINPKAVQVEYVMQLIIPPRECLAFGEKCHKCGQKNHYSTCCRSKQRARGMATVQDHPEVGAQRDVTDLETDTPGQDPEADPIPEVPTA